MKKSIFLLLLALVALTGCKNAQTEANRAEERAAKPVVYVSNYPLLYFASRIAGPSIELHFPGAVAPDPADWNPPADTVAAMQQADLILLSGAGFESWLMNVTLPESLLVDTSEPYASRLLPGEESFTHSHGAEGEHAHVGTARNTWLDFSLALEQAGAVKKALTSVQPDQKDTFETNYQALAADLKDLEEAYRQFATGASSLPLAYSHPLYAYYQHAYGLQGPSLHWEPDAPLDDDMLHEIAHLKEDMGIRYLVWERTPLETSVQKLAEQGITSLVVEVMAGLPESGDFLDGMRRNLDALRQAGAQQP